MRNVLNINKNWIFVKGMTEAPASLPESGEKIDLPHTWNAADGQDGGNDYKRQKCWYFKEIAKTELTDEEKNIIEKLASYKEKYKEQYDRIMNADIEYPIDIMENKGKYVILDGLHRLVKCKLLGYEKVNVRIIPRTEIPNISK